MMVYKLTENFSLKKCREWLTPAAKIPEYYHPDSFSLKTLYRTLEIPWLKLVTDSDGDAGLRRIGEVMQDMLGCDVPAGDTSSEHVLVWKGREENPAVFFYPRIDSRRTGKLTDIAAEAGCGNLAGCRESDEWK